jgi:hypothetical protein
MQEMKNDTLPAIMPQTNGVSAFRACRRFAARFKTVSERAGIKGQTLKGQESCRKKTVFVYTIYE